ncbi:hypothetical protein K7432_001251 [Basidiobolus ranarum]|uniref:Uncharacterized protein n=1 Tax=Basidiobolus ranarum TaxID=34480 RepID=A0ABR2W9Y1_9FUNG
MATKLHSQRQEILENIIKLYSGQASPSCFKNYSKTAVFEDPLGQARGIRAVKSQFYGLAKLFPESVTEGKQILENRPELLRFELRQRYTMPIFRSQKLMRSVIDIHFNSNEEIVRHEERWNDRPLRFKGDGIVGYIWEVLDQLYAFVAIFQLIHIHCQNWRIFFGKAVSALVKPPE